jgi:hypothetical protein
VVHCRPPSGTPVTLVLDLVAWLRIRRPGVTVPAVSEVAAPAAPVLLPAEQSAATPEAAGS